ncbi:hypothetical protein AB28_4852 [Raoultella ornithinolytica 2-156-04_S1_C2]|nr:hypothetical protein AB00_4629 [Raoultella ornithinolytica 2-156-04_S1_C1]KDX09754.1 hypothetical protein AB28_4852 [Raoultella ornithinolytica 2-156-04_S1_C2]
MVYQRLINHVKLVGFPGDASNGIAAIIGGSVVRTLVLRG